MALHVQKLAFWRNQKHWRPDSVVVITGASSGIGRGLALAYAKRRARLVLAARSAEALERVASECRAFNTKAVAVPTDVSSEEACRKLMEAALKAFGQIDVLVLNAGVGCHHSFSDTRDLSIFARLMQINFFGYLFCTKYALEALKQSRGTVLAVSSMSGEIGLPNRTAYCASKFAVTGFLEALRAELEQAGDPRVSIVIVCPPSVRTELRKHALQAEQLDSAAASAPAPAEHNDSAISVEECVAAIIDAADRRLRKAYFPAKAYMGVYVRPFLPDLVDHFVRKSAKL